MNGSDITTETPIPPKTSWRKKAYRLVQALFIIGIVGFLLTALYNGRDQLSTFNWQGNIPTLLFALLLLVVYMIIQAGLWVWMVRRLDLPLDYQTGIPMYLWSQMAKYIPGGVWSFASVGISSAQMGLPSALIMLIYIISMLLIIAISALFALPIFFIFFEDTPLLQWAVLIGLPVALALFLPVTRWVIHFVVRWRKLDVGTEIEQLTNYKTLFSLVVKFFACHLFAAAAFFLYYTALVDATVEQGLYATMAWSGSWFVGILVLIVPSGLGVREATLSGLLALFLPSPVAVALSLGYRLFTTVLDLVILAGLLLYSGVQRLFFKHNAPLIDDADGFITKNTTQHKG